MYDFVNDFRTSPVAFVDYNKLDDTITPIYKLQKFRAAAKKELIVEIKEEAKNEQEPEEALAKIKILKTKKGTRNQVLQTYPKEYTMEYAPEVIVWESTKYVLNQPL